MTRTECNEDGRLKIDENENPGSSPEAAGISRGVAKTASTLSRRAVIGRLPKSGAIPKPTISASSILPKKVPIRQVARVSDRISTGFDAYDAAATSKDGDQIQRQGKRNKWVQRSLSFSGSLLKNTISGAGLFEAFEKVICYLDEKNSDNAGSRSIADENGIERQSDYNYLEHGDAFSRTSLAQHLGAGMVGGSVHSLLQMSFQSVSFIKENGLNSSRMAPISLISSWSLSYTFHHAIAHGLLFSSYEGIKRSLFSEKSLHSSVQSENDVEIFGNSGNDIMTIALAGGIAGQIQHVASHYIESWLGVGEDRNIKTYLRYRKKLFVQAPSFKSICLSFPPSAIGFIAFEFGKSIIS